MSNQRGIGRGGGRGYRGRGYNCNRSYEMNRGVPQYSPPTYFFNPPTPPQNVLPSQFSFPPPPLGQPINYSPPRFSAQENNLHPQAPAQRNGLMHNNPIAPQNFMSGPPGFQQYQPAAQYPSFAPPMGQQMLEINQPPLMQNLGTQPIPNVTQGGSSVSVVPCVYPDLNKFQQSVGMDGSRKVLPVFYYCTDPDGGFLLVGKSGDQEKKKTSSNIAKPILEIVHHVSCDVTSSGSEKPATEESGGTSGASSEATNPNRVLNEKGEEIKNNEARDGTDIDSTKVVEETEKLCKATSFETISDFDDFHDAMSNLSVVSKTTEESIENEPSSSSAINGTEDSQIARNEEFAIDKKNPEEPNQLAIGEKNTEEPISGMPTSSNSNTDPETGLQIMRNDNDLVVEQKNTEERIEVSIEASPTSSNSNTTPESGLQIVVNENELGLEEKNTEERFEKPVDDMPTSSNADTTSETGLQVVKKKSKSAKKGKKTEQPEDLPTTSNAVLDADGFQLVKNKKRRYPEIKIEPEKPKPQQNNNKKKKNPKNTPQPQNSPSK